MQGIRKLDVMVSCCTKLLMLNSRSSSNHTINLEFTKEARPPTSHGNTHPCLYTILIKNQKVVPWEHRGYWITRAKNSSRLRKQEMYFMSTKGLVRATGTAKLEAFQQTVVRKNVKGTSVRVQFFSVVASHP